MPHFIGESAIFQEAKVVRQEPGKAIFRMIMQTANEVNQNQAMDISTSLNNSPQRTQRIINLNKNK